MSTASDGPRPALHLTARVLPGNKIEIATPDFKEGQDVDIFLIPRESEPPPRRSLIEFLDSLPPGLRSAPTWGEIERRFQEDREAWDRGPFRRYQEASATDAGRPARWSQTLPEPDEGARMKTIETTIEVDDHGRATIQLPGDVKPGPYRAVVVIVNQEDGHVRAPLTFSAHDVGPWPEGFTARREEIYGDDGR